MKNRIALLASALLVCACGPKDGAHTLTVLSTNDIHGAWFDSTYVSDALATSLMSVNSYVDDIRKENGAENVLLIDAGDILQGDNCAYYYNYVDTRTLHPYPEMAAYMGYDAVVVGNHDIETGHAVYDRIAAQLKGHGIPFLAGNTITPSGKSYFPNHKLFKKAGLKVLVLGYTNANMKAWLQEDLWHGMDFADLLPLVQEEVDALRKRYKPHVVVVAVHSGTGDGNGQILESQGLDLLNSLQGVDVLACSHDHRPLVLEKENFCLLNSGNKCRNLAKATVEIEIEGGKAVSRKLHAELIPIDPARSDAKMSETFHPWYEKVKSFTLSEVGELAVDLRTRDAYPGMSDYINFVHTVQVSVPEARLSFAAPLSFDKTIEAGTLVFNDMFSLYPYENQMFVVNLTGREIVNYLEYSYDGWIQTPGDHVLKIVSRDDPRYGSKNWSFAGASYNFDSCAGLVYSVDVSKPYGSRVEVECLADGSAFEFDQYYPVAMTSYRASGGGDIMPKGAGVTSEMLESRTVAKYPEIRDMMYDFIKEHGTITSELVSDPAVLGSWKFKPESAEKQIRFDMNLMFGNKN